MFRKVQNEEPKGSRSKDVADRQLIEAAKEGDQNAFRMLYEIHSGRIYSFLYFSLNDPQRAEDALQIVFLKAFRSISQYRYESTFRTWIYKIALNEIRNNLRQKRKHLPLTVIGGTPLEKDLSPNPQEQQVSTQRDRLVKRAMNRLTPKLKTVVVLKYIDGLSYTEIANVLGCTEGTVASRLSRALEKLELLLEPHRKAL